MTSTARLLDWIDAAFGGSPKRKRIGVAVSGGSDSLALLHLLNDWRGAEIAAATVDHGLRAEAGDEAARVSNICAGLGIPHATLRWEGWDGRGNLQDQARQNRYALLAEWARREKIDVVALGHTEDDLAATFLMRLARESGLDGLSSMSARMTRHGMRFQRPLLRATRNDLRAYLGSKGAEWIEDPSNEDRRFDRVRARDALAALKPLGITAKTLAETSRNLEMERFVVAELACDTAKKLARAANGDLIFDRTGLRRRNPAMQRRLIAGALKWVASEAYPPRREALINSGAVSADETTTLHGCLILVTDMTVRITREYNAVRDSASPTDAIWDGRWTLDGPHAPDLEVRALGEALSQCPDWRATGMPRQSLLSTPSVWQGDRLIAAPIAGLPSGWTATTPGRDDFAASLISR